jgi:hypothetical protein
MADKKPLTERQQKLLDILATSKTGDIREAATEAGYSEKTRISEIVAPLKDEIIEMATAQLAVTAPKAVAKLVGVLDDPTALGNKNTIAAVQTILDRIGIVKTERVQVETEQPGVFIVPPKDPR